MHTQELWVFYLDEIKGDPFGRREASIVGIGITICEMYYPIGEPYGDIANDNARRIVACVNACEGISTDQLERIVASGQRLAVGFGQALAAHVHKKE